MYVLDSNWSSTQIWYQNMGKTVKKHYWFLQNVYCPQQCFVEFHCISNCIDLKDPVNYESENIGVLTSHDNSTKQECAVRKVWNLTKPNPFNVTGRMLEPIPAAHLKFPIAKKRQLPVAFSESPDYGSHRDPAEIGLYSLSRVPHCHSMSKNMV